jgi:hypothetical protein
VDYSGTVTSEKYSIRLWPSLGQRLGFAETFGCFQILETSIMNKLLSGRLSKPYGGYKYYPLFTALLKFRHSECEDPRDRIYGLMSLVNPEQRLDIDYAKSDAEVCRETVGMLESCGFSFDHSLNIDVFNLGERLHVCNSRRCSLDDN